MKRLKWSINILGTFFTSTKSLQSCLALHTLQNQRLLQTVTQFFVHDYSLLRWLAELGYQPLLNIEYYSIRKIVNKIPIDSKVNVSRMIILDETRVILSANKEEISIREGHLVDKNDSVRITLMERLC